MIRIVKRNKDGQVIAQCVMQIPRKITSFRAVRVANPNFDKTRAEVDSNYTEPEFIEKIETEEIDNPSLTASLADGWEENYTDFLTPALTPKSEIDIDAMKSEFATATADRKIEIIATLLRLI